MQCFQPIKIRSKGRGVPSICLLIPAEVMASLAEELITEVQKTRPRPSMKACYLIIKVASKLKADR